MSCLRNAGEHFVELHFRAARVRVPDILPVEREDLHVREERVSCQSGEDILEGLTKWDCRSPSRRRIQAVKGAQHERVVIGAKSSRIVLAVPPERR